MAAKQKHIQRVKQRILEKLKSLDEQEQAHFAVLHEHIAKVKQQAKDLLQLEDCGQFLSRYGGVIQSLDAAYNNLELLTADAEDRLTDDASGDIYVDTLVLDTQSVADDSAVHSPSSLLGYAKTSLLAEGSPPKGEAHLQSYSAKPPDSFAKSEELPTNSVESSSSKSGSKHETVSQKHHSVPIEVKKQLKQQLQPVPECGSSTSSSRVQSVEDLSAFEEQVTASSSPKKKSKKAKKKGRSQSSAKNETASSSGKKQKNTDDKCNTTRDKLDNDVEKVKMAFKELEDSEMKKGSMTEKLNQIEAAKQVEKDDNIDNNEVKKKVKEVLKSGNVGKREKLLSGTNRESLSEEEDERRHSEDIEKETTIIYHGEKSTETVSFSKEKQTDVQPIVDSNHDNILSAEAASVEVKAVPHYDETLRIFQGTLLEREATPVIVSEIINPWCFYVQRYGTALNELMEEICKYMSTVGLAEKPLEYPEVGTLCLALYSKDNLYYRGIVTKTYIEVSEVDVVYMDYGNRERVKANKLRALPEKFTALPAQAICCALAEVMPCNKYNEWTEEDIFTFMQYVQRQQLECMPVGRSSGRDMPYLVRLFIHAPMPAVPQASLYLTKISIGALFIDRKLAKEVGIAEQVSLIHKFMEDMGDFVFTLGSSNSSGVEIKELNESQICEIGGSAKKSDPIKIESVSLNLKSESTEMTVKDNVKAEAVDQSLISPRSECSDTESQCDLVVKATEKSDTIQTVKETNCNLPEIKEEAEIDLANIDKVEPAVSACGSVEMFDNVSSITEPDTSDARSVDTGFHSNDLNFNLNLDLNPQGQEVMLAHVKSPGLFYVHVISRQVGYKLDTLMKCLNQEFEKLSKKSLSKRSKSLKPAVNKLCCAQFMEDNCFYRAMIKELPSETDSGDKKTQGKVRVFYIDFGDDEWILQSRLFPLPEQFVNLPPLVLKCSLAYIKPMSTEKDGNNLTWPETATKAFVSLASFEKRLLMHVVHGTLAADRKGELVGEDNSTVGVLLIDNTGAEEICVNMDLIRLGVAELDPAHAPTDKQEPSETMRGWNPMEEDYFSLRNSYNIDVDDAGVAMTGYKAQDEKRICKFYNRGSCWRDDRCPFKHVKSASGVTLDKEDAFVIHNNQESLLPEVHCWVAMEISTILTPGHFYAILPMGNKSLDGAESKKDNNEVSVYGELKETETLDDLQASLNEEYSRKSMHEGTLILRAPGEIVAARFHQDQQWYRARVLQSTEEKVKVFYLDFGNTEWLSVRDIHEIQPQFLHLPFQAIECFLHNVEPVGDGETWSKEAKIGFRQLVDGKTLVGHIKSKSWNGCIWVELYDTTGEDDINISDAMIEKGYAVRSAAFTETSSEAGTSFKSDSKSEILMVPG